MEDPRQLTKLHLVSRSDMINVSTYINLKTPTLSQIETKTPLTPLIYSLRKPQIKNDADKYARKEQHRLITPYLVV